MFSVTNTGTNLRPLWTTKVSPTASGTRVERRDQVLMTFFAFAATASSIFFARCPSTKGPFLMLRAIRSALCLPMLHDHRVRSLVVASLEALGELPPGGARVTAAARATYA